MLSAFSQGCSSGFNPGLKLANACGVLIFPETRFSSLIHEDLHNKLWHNPIPYYFR
jgi:hypothetical protein